VRILLITDKFIPERGGSQRFLGNLYGRLEGHAVTVLTREWEGAAETDRDYPHTVVRVPYPTVARLRSPVLWWRLRRAARRLLATQPFEQVHCGQTVETAPWGTVLAARNALPSLVHTFGEDVTCYLNRPVYRRLMEQGLRRAAVVTTISAYTEEQLQGLGVPAARIVRLTPGIEPERWAGADGAEMRERWGVAGRPVLLTLSRLIPRKGVDTVIQALPAVLAEVPDAAYVVVGEGADEPRLRVLAAQAGVAEAVRFVGAVAEADLPACYRAADVFVMPNRQMPDGDVEGFGQVFLEANACGVPVIAGRSGGAVDAVEDGVTGFLVDPTSPGEVAARAVELLRSPDLARRLGEAGRRRAAEAFTWRHSAAQLAGAIARAGAG
jgi:phosphatidylinositol alpha-1,6-mannosyltransferase